MFFLKSSYCSRVSTGQIKSCCPLQISRSGIHPILLRWRWRARVRWSPSGSRIKPTVLHRWRMSWRYCVDQQGFGDLVEFCSKHLFPQGVGWSDGSKEESWRHWGGGTTKSWRINLMTEKRRSKINGTMGQGKIKEQWKSFNGWAVDMTRSWNLST